MINNVFSSVGTSLYSTIAFSNWVSSDGVRYRKSGRFVELNINKAIGSPGITINPWSSQEIGTIAGYANSLYFSFVGSFLTTGNQRNYTLINVTTDGTVAVFNNSTSAITVLDIIASAVLVTDG